MMFRRLYWVTERVQPDGATSVRGVYTSIPDLLDHGLPAVFDGAQHCALRLSLVKLDSRSGPLGTWTTTEFGRIAEDLQPYVVTGEFAIESVNLLRDELEKLLPATQKP
jgi:hypothetical protein